MGLQRDLRLRPAKDALRFYARSKLLKGLNVSTIAEVSLSLSLSFSFSFSLSVSLSLSISSIQVALEAWKKLPQSFILAAYIACGWLTLDEALKNLHDLGRHFLKGGEWVWRGSLV